MKSSFCILIGAAATLLAATPAFADMASEVAGARAEAIIAARSNDMDSVKMHLARGGNCMVGEGDGYYYAPPGNPCAGQGKGAIADSKLNLQKKRLSDAFNRLGAGQAQSRLEDAHRLANEAIELLDSAMATNE